MRDTLVRTLKHGKILRLVMLSNKDFNINLFKDIESNKF